VTVMQLATASQATSIEQARAIAEVLAAIEAANRNPRSEEKAAAAMAKACASRALAEKAFYAVARGEGTASGESIHLARELARCWSHLNYGTKELSRDDARGVSEIQAYAFDLETLVRVESTFILPHRKSLKGGNFKQLTDLGQIYENNANAGARRVRECIMNVLPYGFVAEAARLCQQTLTRMDSGELTTRIDKVIADFGRGNIDRGMLETKIGHPVALWTAEELVELEVLFASLKRKEISRDEAFPTAAVTSATILSLAQPAPSSSAEGKATTELTEDQKATELTEDEKAEAWLASQEPPQEPQQPAPQDDRAAEPGITPALSKKLHARLKAAGHGETNAGLAYLSDALGRNVMSSKELTAAEAIKIIEGLDRPIEPTEPEQLWHEGQEPNNA